MLRLSLCMLLCVVGIHAGKGFGDDMAEVAAMLRKSCAEETGVDISILDKINEGADLTPDAKLKCYIKCVLETAGMMSDGEIDIEMVLVILPAGIVERNAASLRACGTKKGTDDCDTAYLTQVCWQQSNRDDYFIV